MGILDADIDDVVAAFDRSDLAMLNAMKALEFGHPDSERRSPYRAMVASGGLFLVGSLPSIIPFIVFDSTTTALTWATILAMAGLFIVGVVKARVARHHWLRSGLENLVIAGVGGLAAWWIGSAVGTAMT
jgi:predicted membrane protein (TIGR00267 family)